MQSLRESQWLDFCCYCFLCCCCCCPFDFVELKLTLKFTWKCKGLRVAKGVMKNRIGVLRLADTKTYYKTVSIKTA